MEELFRVETDLGLTGPIDIFPDFSALRAAAVALIPSDINVMPLEEDPSTWDQHCHEGYFPVVAGGYVGYQQAWHCEPRDRYGRFLALLVIAMQLLQRAAAWTILSLFNNPILTTVILITLYALIHRARIYKCICLYAMDQIEPKPYAHRKSLRKALWDHVSVTNWACSDHSHGQDAAHRSSAGDTFEAVALTMGLSPYFYQMSASDQKKGRRGSRRYYWDKDMSAERRNDSHKKDELLIMIDVDYYVDMNAFMTEHYTPMAIYTHILADASVEKGCSTYTFEGKTMHMDIRGGEKFSHELWDYNRASASSFTWMSGWTISPTYVCYNIDTRTHSAFNKGHVILTPMAKCTGMSAVLAYYFLGCKPLERLDPQIGEYTAIRVLTEIGRASCRERV